MDSSSNGQKATAHNIVLARVGLTEVIEQFIIIGHWFGQTE